MSKLFISHSSDDDGFVRELRQVLADHGEAGWIDSRELRGGDRPWSEIQKAIEEASGYAVVVSPDALQSKWVGKELRHALDIQERRGKDNFPVIPLSLNGTKLGVLEQFFDEEPLYIPVTSDAGGVEAAVNAILAAVGKRLPADVAPTLQPKAEPLEELVLELTDLMFEEKDGRRRASARARLVYEPATPGRPAVHTARAWRFVAPIGPTEAADLTWYLEKYAIWPSGIPVIQQRARKVEESLVTWGRLLHGAAMPPAHVGNVNEAWKAIDAHADRRFSILVDVALEAGASEEQLETAQEAATLLLGLPWELLHDGWSFLFQGATPTCARRRLPNTCALDVPVVATPIRILLVAARPEDEACGYTDHRASALPMVEAMESLPGLVRLHVLSPPTLPALREELDRARRQGEPYHVVHFDGHGVYDRRVGLGGLCFEHPEDIDKLEKRRHVTVFTSQLGPLLRDHRIPLVFLDACETAQAEKASESIATELLKVGVGSVVAMSHSVLVETARRFVEAFYQALASGKRVGDAMLEGRRRLKDDTSRGRVFGAGELHLEDWFVPVLFQEKDDPQLFKTTPAKQTRADFKAALQRRLGSLPPPPMTGFIGRSRELLALQRLLCNERYAVVRGQGGEGKTALAAELARWMVCSHQVRRAAFVSLETHSHAAAVLDAIGRQLVGPAYSVAMFGELEKAVQPVERELAEQRTLLVVDNLESILQPPWLTTSEALSEDMRFELDATLKLCARLNATGDTRLVFTSREPLPAPFDAQRSRRDLRQLEREDAVRLVERALNAAGGDPGAPGDAAREQIERLVDAVHCHARTIALLAPALLQRGVEATRESLVELMAEMEKKFPGSREQSAFASVELSLRRLSPANRDRVRGLAAFHGAVQLDVLRQMMHWDEADTISLAHEVVKTGLATPNRYNHLTLNPALCPYLRNFIGAAEQESLTARWVEAMHHYREFLAEQQHQHTEVASALTMLDLPNLFALLDRVQGAGDAEATIDLATSLYSLLQLAGKPRLLERIGQARDAAAAALGKAWDHARFLAAWSRIDQQFARGHLREALAGARQLLECARTAGEKAYPEAHYDSAAACFLLARVLKAADRSEQALLLLNEARQRFEAVPKGLPGTPSELAASMCFAEQGDCLRNLGRLEEAETAFEENIRRGEQLGDARQVAVGKYQLGAVRMLRRRYPEALAACADAREQFMRLGEPGSLAAAWHRTGAVYQEAGEPQAAEDAYRKSLAINVQLGNAGGQADTLVHLGRLYDAALGRTGEAVGFYRQATDKYVEIGDGAGEGTARNNLAVLLRKLRRLAEAREEIRRAIECRDQSGHASQPWAAWTNLAVIETDAGNHAAAAEAKRKATAAYLAYRRDGGENYGACGHIALDVTKPLLAGNPAEAASLLQHFAADPDGALVLPFVRALEAVVAGSRDLALADAQDLDCTMAAEILLLIETLEKRR